MAITMKNTQRTTLTVVPKRNGKTAPLGSVPTWSVTPANILPLQPSADGMTCVAGPAGAPTTGTFTVTCTAHGDPAVTNGTLHASITITVTQ